MTLHPDPGFSFAEKNFAVEAKINGRLKKRFQRSKLEIEG